MQSLLFSPVSSHHHNVLRDGQLYLHNPNKEPPKATSIQMLIPVLSLGYWSFRNGILEYIFSCSLLLLFNISMLLFILVVPFLLQDNKFTFILLHKYIAIYSLIMDFWVAFSFFYLLPTYLPTIYLSIYLSVIYLSITHLFIFEICSPGWS
jgi:hypothetical protein